MTKLKIAVMASAFVLAALPAEARDSYRSQGEYTSYKQSQSYVRHIKSRIARQEYRISSAWRHGRLDRDEKYKLVSKLEKIKSELRYACADDRVSHYENRNLQHLLDRNGKRIVHYHRDDDRRHYRKDRRHYSYKDYGGQQTRRYKSYGERYRTDY